MNPRGKIQNRKTSKKANRKMNSIQLKTNNSVEIEQWERDLADRIFGKRCQEKEVEPTFSIQHPEDEATKEDLNKQAEEKETNAEQKEAVPDIIETSMREIKEKEDQYKCNDCKIRFENKNNLRDHVCNTQEDEEKEARKLPESGEAGEEEKNSEAKEAVHNPSGITENKLNNEPENLIVINTDKEKELSLFEKMDKIEAVIVDVINQEEEYITQLLQNEPQKYVEIEAEDCFLVLCKDCTMPLIVHGEDHQIVFNKKRITVETDLFHEATEIIEIEICNLKAFKVAGEKIEAIHAGVTYTVVHVFYGKYRRRGNFR